MHHYESDSPHTVSRLLALTALADGGLGCNEIEALMEADLACRLRVGRVEFERILREHCDDLLASAHCSRDLRLNVAGEVLDLLLEDIADPALQRALLHAMQDIASADGVETAAEVYVLGRALEKWGGRAAAGRFN